MSYNTLLNAVALNEMTRDQAYIKQTEMLSAKLDPRLVATRSQSGQSLSYLEAHVVIQMLNHVFGYGGWDMHVNDFREVMREQYMKDEGTAREKKMYKVGYAALGTLEVRFINGIVGRYSDSGYGSGITSTGFGDASESSLKESESDLLKRCARHVGFALQLYDKEQRRVGFDDNTILILPISASDLRGVAGKNVELTKQILGELGKEKLTDLSPTEIESMFKRLSSSA